MKFITKNVKSIVEHIKLMATVITSLGVVGGLVLYLARPHIQRFVIEALPMNTLTPVDRTIELERKLTETIQLQEKLRQQNLAIKETLVKQDANIRVLIFITRGKDGFDQQQGVQIPE